MNRLLSFAPGALLAAAVLSAPSPVSAAVVNWTGGSSLNWSDPANWDSPIPGSHDSIYFGELSGYTNIAGVVNNIVDAENALGSAWYTALAQSGGIHFYTTLIPSGVTLTLGGLGSSSPALAVGDVPGQSPLSSGNATNYSTIKGAGSLLMNDSSSLLSVGMRNRATLDLSGLSSVTANLKQVWVGASPFNSASSSSANFSGGNVDILVDSLYIGRSSPAIGLTSATTGTGTLLVENGTVTATNVYMSYKMTSANNTAGNGVLVLRSNATMNVAKDFYLCFRTNGSAFLNQPILAISNNGVLNIGGNLACTNVGGWSPAAIILGASSPVNRSSLRSLPLRAPQWDSWQCIEWTGFHNAGWDASLEFGSKA